MSRQTPSIYMPRERVSRVVAPYLIPWGGAIALIPASLITRLAWDSPGAAPWAAIAMAAATAGVTVVARTAARSRGSLIRVVATATAAACGSWWTAATFAGLGSATLSVWLMLFFLVGISFNSIRLLRLSGTEFGTIDGLDGLTAQVRAMRRARIRNPRSTNGRVSADLEMVEGVPIDDFITDAGRSHVAALLDVPASWVRTARSTESARRGIAEIVPDDHLRDVLPWPGPSAPGESIGNAIVLGQADDAQPLRIWLPGDVLSGRPATHVLILGMSGAGKTKTFQLLAAEVMTRNDTEAWLIETRKGDQTIGPIKAGATQVATDQEAAKRLLIRLVNLIPQRTQWLGERDYEQWETGCGLPYLVVFIGDAAQVVAGSPQIIDAAEAARSAGISLVLDMQRPSHDRIPVAARSNFGAVLLHGVNRRADTKIASETLYDAGATPESWGAKRPGYLYVEAPGLDEERLKIPHRAYMSTPAQLRAAIADTVTEGQPSEFAETDAYEEHPVPRISLVPPPVDRRMDTEQARKLLDQRIRALAEAGWDRLQPSDLADVLGQTGRGASWLTGELKSRCDGDDPTLADAGRGVYRIAAEVVA